MKLIYLFILISLLSINATLAFSTQQDVIENGVNIVDKSITYSDHQYYLLASYNFDSYRNYTTKRMVQIEDGPIIELLSITDMQLNGKQISDEIINQKRGETSSAQLKKIITLINIGFKYPAPKNTETGF